MKKSLGLYIHIPFCRSKCLYCDFCSFPRPKDELVDAYLRALERDLIQKSDLCREYEVDTVYFGGGTPTSLPGELLPRLLDTVTAHYRISENAEITAECNPTTENLSLFRAMRASGFNRLSVGVQSLHEKELKALGRIHSFSDVERTFSDARAAGFSNLSADVMFGIPHQTPESYLQTLEGLAALEISHLSAYGLQIEEGTPFHRMEKSLPLPDEDAAERMYFEGIELLSRHGLEQYEISNFAKEGYESRHNLKYWSCDEYLGFGVAAHSDFCGERFGNSRDLNAYIEGREITEERESISFEERKNEYVMLRMRLADGVRASDFEARFGESFQDTFGARLKKYEASGLVHMTEEGAAFTPRGMYLSNAILSDILDF